jgi:hypothetical protein
MSPYDLIDGNASGDCSYWPDLDFRKQRRNRPNGTTPDSRENYGCQYRFLWLYVSLGFWQDDVVEDAKEVMCYRYICYENRGCECVSVRCVGVYSVQYSMWW